MTAKKSGGPIRRRLNASHRWTDLQTLCLVQEISSEVKENLEGFEKPTAQIFYKRIATKSPELKSIYWVMMKNKMRYLKSLFIAAINWKNQSAADILINDGDAKSVERHIERICPHWYYLERIFGERINTLQNQHNDDESMGEQKFFVDVGNVDSIDEVVDESNFSECIIPEEDSLIGEHTDSTDDQPPSVTKIKNSEDPFTLLISLQEKKLEIEIRRFELEERMAKSDIELKKKTLEQEFVIRKLQIESEERIRIHELELKYKTNI